MNICIKELSPLLTINFFCGFQMIIRVPFKQIFLDFYNIKYRSHSIWNSVMWFDVFFFCHHNPLWSFVKFCLNFDVEFLNCDVKLWCNIYLELCRNSFYITLSEKELSFIISLLISKKEPKTPVEISSVKYNPWTCYCIILCPGLHFYV